MLGNNTGAFKLRDAYVNDTEDVSAFSWMFKSSTDTVKLLSGMPGVTYIRLDESTQAVTSTRSSVGERYHPVDTRPRKHRRASQKSYRKAKAHYEKTYVVTAGQLYGALAVTLGTAMILSVLLFQFYIWFAGLAGAI